MADKRFGTDKHVHQAMFGRNGITAEQIKDIDNQIIVEDEPVTSAIFSEEDENKICDFICQNVDLSERSKSSCYHINRQVKLIQDVKKLFKMKRLCKRNPETSCKIKIQTWEQHNKMKCDLGAKDYELIGEVVFPVCSKEIFHSGPGAPLRKSPKSFTVNNPNTFRKDNYEQRKFAYPDRIIPLKLYENEVIINNNQSGIKCDRKGSH